MITQEVKKGQKQAITSTVFEESIAKYAVSEERENTIRQTIETEITELLEKYHDELETLAQNRKTAFDIAQAYCQQNKEALFAKRRSIATPHGCVGYRLGTPRLKTTKGSNWNQILAILKDKLPAYIRITEEPAKDLLLADRHKEQVAPLLAQIGIEVVQDDLFYIETKNAA